MATNPFAGIINADMKQLHKDMIDSLLETTALTVPCRLIFRGSLYNDTAVSGSVNPIGNTPPGAFSQGGPFFGPPRDDVVPNEETATLYMMVIWTSKNWMKTALAKTLINSPDMHIQTICKVSDLVLIKQADKMVVDTDLEAKVQHTFTRVGEPELCGFGASTHISTMWKKIG